MSWKSDIALFGGLGLAAYLAITNADKIGAWIRSQIPGAAKETAKTIVEAGGGIIIEAGKGAFEAGETLGDALGLGQAGQALGQAQQAVSQAVYETGYSAGVATQDFSSMLYEAGYALGQTTQNVLSGISSFFFPQQSTSLSQANQTTTISGNTTPDLAAGSTIQPFPTITPADYQAAAASNLGTKYAGWEKLYEVPGGIVPKPGMDWWGSLPTKFEWSQYQAWLSK